MQLTKQTDIALRVLVQLASVKKLTTIKEISSQHSLSNNHLMKVVPKLVGLGYIKATRGRGGGLTLDISPKNIVVGDVVRAIESSLDIIDCEAIDCPWAKSCALKQALNESARAFLKTLDGITVQDLVRF